MKKCKFIILFVGILITTNVFAQFDNVNLFTGTPEITIPITTIALNDFTLPISLSYAGVGIKVAEKATWAGLGWNLNTGGYIVRITRGKVDDVNFDPNPFTVRDFEPDIFKYSFGNKSGTFIVNSDKTVDLVPFYNIQITPLFASSGIVTGFIFKDDDGTIYSFLTTAYSAIKYTLYYCPAANYQGECYMPLQKYTHTNITNYAWYVTNVITKNNENIEFNYADENCIVQCGMLFSASLVGQRLKNITTQKEIIEFNESSVVREDDPSSKYLDNILIKAKTSIGESIVKGFKFKYSYNVSNNSAIPGTTQDYKRLMLDKLYEHDGNDNFKMPSYEFGYFTSSGMPNIKSKAQDLWGYYNGMDDATNLKPTIYIYPNEPNDQYRILPIPNYTGTFYTKDGANRIPNPDFMKALILSSLKTPMGAIYSYNYVPHKYIYQNNEYQGGGLRIQNISVSGISPTMNTTYNYIDYENGSVSSGKLLGIPIYAYRGKPNCPVGVNPLTLTESQFYNYTTVVTEESDVNVLERKIAYRTVEVENGTNGKSRFSFHIPFTFNENNAAHSTLVNESTDPKFLIRTDPLVWCTDISGTEFVSRNAYFKRLGSLINGYNIYPFAPNTNYDWDNGQLLNKTDFNNVGNIVKQTIYTYNNFYLNGNYPKILNVIKTGNAYYLFDYHECIHCGFPGSTHCAFENEYFPGTYCVQPALQSNYNILTGVASKLSSTIETIYNSIGNPITNSTDYKYNQIGQVSSVSQTQSNGTSLKTTYKYVPNYLWGTNPSVDAQSGILYNMNARNMINIPIEKTQLKNDQVISSTLNLFKETSDNIIVPDVTYSIDLVNAISEPFSGLSYTTFSPGGLSPYGTVYFRMSSLYDPKVFYDLYDNKGNLLQCHTSNNLYISYIWGYNKFYPVAKIENATFAEVQTALGGTIPDLGASGLSVYQNTNLRYGLPNALVTTNTYSPLIGMSSQIDPNGLITSYDYDEFGRLKLVKDKDGEILKSYGYHYSDTPSQVPSLNVSTNSVSLAATISSSSFSITANCAWTLASSAAWLTVNSSSGYGNGSITVNATANSGATRSATVTVTNGNGLSQSINILQSTGNQTSTLSTDQNYLEFGMSADIADINVSSNTSWNVTKSQSWIGVIEVSGSGDGTVGIKVTKLTSGTRTGYITLTTSDGSVSININVSQSANPQ